MEEKPMKIDRKQRSFLKVLEHLSDAEFHLENVAGLSPEKAALIQSFIKEAKNTLEKSAEVRS